MSQQNITLRARGLYTFPNQLGEVPEGGLQEASNVTIDKDGTVSPRRGFKLYGTTLGTGTDRAKQLLVYQNRIIRHWGTTMDVDSDGNASPDGNFAQLYELDNQTLNIANVLPTTTGLRIKYQEANGNLYFTSSTGIRKLSCNSNVNMSAQPITNAGGIKALDGSAVLVPGGGWFLPDSTVAYRQVWGIKDINTNVILGVPSERIIISNGLQSSLVVDYNSLISSLATVAAVSPVVLTGNGAGTTTISGLSSTANLSIGMTVADTTTPGNVPANTYIVTIGTNSITVSNAVGTFTGNSLSFGQRLTYNAFSSLLLSPNSSATVLYNALQFLANGDTNILDVNLAFQTKQVTPITVGAQATFAGTGVSDYFDIFANRNATYYRVWFQSGTSIAPAQPLNSTMIQVTVNSGDTALTVAGRLAQALSNTGSFTTDSPAVVPYATAKVLFTDVVYGLNNSALAYSSTGTSIVVGNAGAGFKFGVDPVFGVIPLTPATAPSDPALTGQLTQMQNYLNNIIAALNSTSGISTHALQSIGGAFSNSVGTATVNLTFTVPADVTTANFYQIYRSAMFQSSTATTIADIVPDDELQLIFEANATSTDISNKSITFHDTVPDSFRAAGTFLYTNANSGQGITQANYPPPLAQDMTLFLNNTFYANTALKFSVELGLLSGVNLAGHSITIAQGGTHNTYNFVIPQVTDIQCIEGDLFKSSGTSDSFDIYSANSATKYRIWFQEGTSTAPSGVGVTLVQVSVLSTDTSTQVATKLVNALKNVTDFSCVQTSDIVEITDTTFGATTSPVNNVANAAFSITVITFGIGSGSTVNPIVVSTAPTPSQVIDATARNIVSAINQNSGETTYAYYISGPSDLPGLINFEARAFGNANFFISGDSNVTSNLFNPTLGTIAPITAISIANPTHITSTAHGLSTGNQIIISGSNSTPNIDGIYTITRLDANTFTIPVNVTVAGSTGGWILTSAAIQGSNDAHPNRLFFSKTSQPEAVPLVNFIDIGPKNAAIVRILPLRSSLIVLSQAGVYQLSGTDATNFQVQLFDASTKIAAADSAAVLNNQIFLFANQGISSISETGIQVISRPIENLIIPLLTPQYTNFSTATFAVSYEADRAYLLSTVVNTGDTVANIIYRWNTFTTTWTTWNMSKTCGVVEPSQNILYWGASDTNSIEVERKTFSRTDQADREQILTIPVNGVANNFLFFGNLLGTAVGDGFVQTQYLTVAWYNRLLQQLDTDAGLTFNSYYNTYGVSSGTKLRDDLTVLAAALDTDSGLVSPGFAAAISGFGSAFVDEQSAFNTITNLLNLNAGTRNKNYPTSTGTTMFETTVTAINTATTVITLLWPMPFIAGPITQYKAIDSSVTWAFHHFGDASMVKQVSESTILFNKVDFTSAVASFASDLAPGFLPTPMPEEGPGLWGGFTWGDGDIWGGEGASFPFRTYIPREKQRCRYITGKFEHDVAREHYDIYGISYTYTPVSNRGYQR
jgi:hypothetical protein